MTSYWVSYTCPEIDMTDSCFFCILKMPAYNTCILEKCTHCTYKAQSNCKGNANKCRRNAHQQIQLRTYSLGLLKFWFESQEYEQTTDFASTFSQKQIQVEMEFTLTFFRRSWKWNLVSPFPTIFSSGNKFDSNLLPNFNWIYISILQSNLRPKISE